MTLKQRMIQICIYICGLFINAFGVVLSTMTGLGTACVSCFCTNAHNLFQVSLGTAFSGLYTFYVFLEFLILRKEFGLKNFLQLGFAWIFGYFTDFIKSFIVVQPKTFLEQISILIVSFVILSIGVVILVNSGLVPSAPDGFVQVVADQVHRPFGSVKVVHDTIIAILGVLLGLIYGRVEGLGIATLLAALTLGRIIGLIEKVLKSPIQKLCHVSH